MKILDFGLASMQQSANVSDSIVQTAALTEPGLLMGTIGYTSPEQLAAKPLTPATDVFSFGCVLFEMLQGQMPFKRDSNMEVIASILRDEPVTRDAAKPLPPDDAHRRRALPGKESGCADFRMEAKSRTHFAGWRRRAASTRVSPRRRSATRWIASSLI